MPCIYMNAFIFAVGGFASAFYWSSTENNNNNAWKQNFNNGTKTTTIRTTQTGFVLFGILNKPFF